jgi:hypothetical protein
MATRPISITALLSAVKLAKANPQMTFTVKKGQPITSKDVLTLWRNGIAQKCARGAELTPRQHARHDDLAIDARRIQEYRQGMRCSGCRGLLRDARMRRRYPHINNQPWSQ